MGLLRRVTRATKGRKGTQAMCGQRCAGNSPGVRAKERGCIRRRGRVGFFRPDGYLVYLAEAAGRECSHPNLPQQMRACSPLGVFLRAPPPHPFFRSKFNQHLRGSPRGSSCGPRGGQVLDSSRTWPSPRPAGIPDWNPSYVEAGDPRWPGDERTREERATGEEVLRGFQMRRR